MAPWYEPMKSQFFVSGVVILACLAFFLMWAVRNHGPQVYLCILIAMFGVGSLQGAYVLIYLFNEQQSRPRANNNNIPMDELEPFNSSDDEE